MVQMTHLFLLVIYTHTLGLFLKNLYIYGNYNRYDTWFLIFKKPFCIVDVIGEVLDFGGLNISHGARKEVVNVEFTLRDIK